MLRFVTDESASQLVTDYLREQGHDVIAVAELSAGVDDNEVLALAVREQRILVTADKDFGTLVFKQGRTHFGILLLRPDDSRPTVKVAVTKRVLTEYGHWLATGFVVATEHSVRIHPLP